MKHQHQPSSLQMPQPDSTDIPPQALLASLMGEMEIPHQNSLQSLIKTSQQWRRQPGQERWEMQDIVLPEEKEKAVMGCLEQLSLIKELTPERTHFEYALLLGATVPRMERRMNHLAQLWEQGVRFNKLIFLVGQRPLVDAIDKTDSLIAKNIGKQATGHKAEVARPLTETEGARLVYESINMPASMKHVEVDFIDSPRNWEGDHWQRANTRDTLKRWMLDRPEPGATLVISDQPHALYQLEVVRQELPDAFLTEVAAQQADKDARLILCLDALALWLHNLQSRLGNQ